MAVFSFPKLLLCQVTEGSQEGKESKSYPFINSGFPLYLLISYYNEFIFIIMKIYKCYYLKVP